MPKKLGMFLDSKVELMHKAGFGTQNLVVEKLASALHLAFFIPMHIIATLNTRIWNRLCVCICVLERENESGPRQT